MNLLQMTVSAGLLVIAIIIIRAVALNRLPKKMFLILWGVVLARLLIPVAIPINIDISNTAIGGIVERVLPDSSASPVVENVIPNVRPDAAPNVIPGVVPDFSIIPEMSEIPRTTETPNIIAEQPTSPQQREVFAIAPITLIWLVGMVATFVFFAAIYIKIHKTLRFATIIKDNDFLDKWLMEHRLKRPIVIMQSDRVKSPLAVGIINPRIILPKSIDLNDKLSLNYILNHEYYHIKRFDALWKMILLFAVCIHWFNPIMWVMFVLVNRDLELTCDEAVVKHFGGQTKKTYAYMLINMAEHEGAIAPLYSGFSKNATEERIVSIMKMKKTSIIGMVIAFVLVPILTIIALGTFSAPPVDESAAANEYPITNPSDEYALTDYETSINDTLNTDDPTTTTYNPPIKVDLTAAQTLRGEPTRLDTRIQILSNEPDFAENEPCAFRLNLYAYLVELVLQGDIQDHILDFTCELCPGGELSVKIVEGLVFSDVRRTGNTRQVNGVMQREMSQNRHALTVCSECFITNVASMACVIWREIWWEDSHLNIENRPLGIILENDTPVFESNIDTEPFFDIDESLMRIHQGAVVVPVSECDNGRIFVYVTSVGGWPVHNGWYTWSLWIPCDSFELTRTEFLSDEMRFCTCE